MNSAEITLLVASLLAVAGNIYQGIKIKNLELKKSTLDAASLMEETAAIKIRGVDEYEKFLVKNADLKLAQREKEIEERKQQEIKTLINEFEKYKNSNLQLFEIKLNEQMLLAEEQFKKVDSSRIQSEASIQAIELFEKHKKEILIEFVSQQDYSSRVEDRYFKLLEFLGYLTDKQVRDIPIGQIDSEAYYYFIDIFEKDSEFKHDAGMKLPAIFASH